MSQIQASWREVREEDITEVCDLLRGGILSVVNGGILDQFESEFADFAGVRYAVAVNNGTAAIYAALWAVGVGPGDDVLVCDYGFHGVAAAVLSLGARVVPVDCMSDSLTIDADDIRRSRTSSAKALVIHNPWGVPADFASIRAAAAGLALISDASHAHGATYDDRSLASWAEVTCFSLGRGKLISGGELGCAVTDDPTLRDRMMTLGHVNRVPEALITGFWGGNAIGLKLRPHPVAIALARCQLRRYQQKLGLLLPTCRKVEAGLSEVGFLPQAVPPGSQRVYWKLVFRLDQGIFGNLSSELLAAALRRERIPVEPNYAWPALQNQSIFDWPGNAERISRRKCPVAFEVIPRTVIFPAPVIWPDLLLRRFIATTKRVVDSVLRETPVRTKA